MCFSPFLLFFSLCGTVCACLCFFITFFGHIYLILGGQWIQYFVLYQLIVAVSSAARSFAWCLCICMATGRCDLFVCHFRSVWCCRAHWSWCRYHNWTAAVNATASTFTWYNAGNERKKIGLSGCHSQSIVQYFFCFRFGKRKYGEKRFFFFVFNRCLCARLTAALTHEVTHTQYLRTHTGPPYHDVISLLTKSTAVLM